MEYGLPWREGFETQICNGSFGLLGGEKCKRDLPEPLRTLFITFRLDELETRARRQPLDRMVVEEWPGRDNHDERESRTQETDV